MVQHLWLLICGQPWLLCTIIVSLAWEIEGIYGGQEAIPHSYPFMVNIRCYRDNEDRVRHHCGGTILTPDLFISALHCIPEPNLWDSDQYEVVVGDHRDENFDGPEQVTKFSRGFSPLRKEVVYPNHHHGISRPPSEYDMDVVIVQVDPPFIFNDYVQPIDRIIRKDEDLFGDATVCGWGWTAQGTDPNELRELNMTILGQCASKDIICAGTFQGEGVCSYDSGSPLSQQIDGETILVGIVVHSYEEPGICGQPPDAFINLQWYHRFIDRVLTEVGEEKLVKSRRKLQSAFPSLGNNFQSLLP